MTLVRVINEWALADMLRQTPGGCGVWEDIQFVTGPVAAPDFVICVNIVQQPTTVTCAPRRVWSVLQEPPRGVWAGMHRDLDGVGRQYTTNARLSGAQYRLAQPALPWLVNRSYDELRALAPPDKPKALSWITSNIRSLPGHRQRMRFLDAVRAQVDFDLFGRGFTFIEDKWDALAPYRYALAVENDVNPYYWTEKIADCFLAWTMPIYYGCSRIAEYFPREAFVAIDIHDPDAPRQIREVLASDRAERHRDAIAYARELVLTRYQFFPFFAQEIRAAEQADGACVDRPETLTLHHARALARFTRFRETPLTRAARAVKRAVMGRPGGRAAP